MRTSLRIALASAFVAGAAGQATAQSIAVSIGVRETGSTAPLGQDGGGAGGGIEWVDRDANLVALDGTWQQVSFNLSSAQLLAFAGATANSVWDGTRGVLEHMRLRNTDGLTAPLRLFIDDLVVTGPGQPNYTEGWEGVALGAEHIFRAPGFSGSTIANLTDAGSSAASAAMPRTGAQSYEMNLQFVDADPMRWARVTTFDTATGANPTVDFGGVVSFWIKGEVVPAPGAGVVLLLAGAAGLRRRR